MPLPAAVRWRLSEHIAALPASAGDAAVERAGHANGTARTVTAALMFTTGPGGALQPVHVQHSGLAARAGHGWHHQTGDGMHAAEALLRQRPAGRRVDVKALSEYLGHHDPAITLRIYAHLMPRREARALKAIEDALSGEDHGPEHGPGGRKPADDQDRHN